MANNKTGFIYFSIDTDRYQDYRIKKLKKEFKGDGVAIYDYILCEIYRVKGCFLEWDESTAFDVADYWGIKETLVNEIVNYCCHVGLFNKALFTSERTISSNSILARYIGMCEKAKRKNMNIPEKIYKLLEGCPKPTEESGQNDGSLTHSKVKNSKEKESKVKENSPELFGTKIIFNPEIILEKILANEDWIFNTSRFLKFPREKIEEMITNFIEEQKLKHNLDRSLIELMEHFISWAKKPENQNNNYIKNNGNTGKHSSQKIESGRTFGKL